MPTGVYVRTKPNWNAGKYRYPDAENEVHYCSCPDREQIPFRPEYRTYGYPRFIQRHYWKGHTKENDPVLAAMGKKVFRTTAGRTKEDYPYLAALSKALTGRSAADYPYLTARAEKIIREGILAGANNGNWRGGKSFEPYTPAWTEALKESIRERDNHTCQKCGVPQTECVVKLTVHHIDYIKAHSTPDNLISLCNPCNGKVNTNREYWTEYFQNKLRRQNFGNTDRALLFLEASRMPSTRQDLPGMHRARLYPPKEKKGTNNWAGMPMVWQ